MNRVFMCIFIVYLTFASTSFAETLESVKPTANYTIADRYRAQVELETVSRFTKSKQNEAKLDYTLAKVEHRKNLMGIAENMYMTQLFMTVGVFIIVSVLVIGGAWLSYQQFLLDADEQRQAKSKGEQVKAAIKISRDGVEFSSSVIGLMMLFMSFFFFYMYVSEVYTIKGEKMEPLKFMSEITEKKDEVVD
ncbi:hypothetical protein [Vibrio sp. WXL210]|uniref:hypothetical protein n=1 Tax=Vibrio sp. WXL210 TaxID=3450709 RepID=UPI003EC5436F